MEDDQQHSPQKKGRGRGYTSMSPEQRREIASKAGKAAHALGTAHKWTSEETQAAGRKGGSISRRAHKFKLEPGDPSDLPLPPEPEPPPT
jgi:general stress protein YciG